MPVTRRTMLALGTTTLLGGCAIEPPPTIRQLAAAESAAAARSSALPATTTPVPSVSVTARPTQTAPTETAGSARPATAESTGQAPANHVTAANSYAVPAAQVHDWLITRTGPARPTAFLTYDDGPSPNLTPLLLDALAAQGVHATFFVVGYRLEQNPAIAQRALAEGHSICLHSYAHDYRYLYPGRVGDAGRIAADYDRALAVAKQALGSSYVSPGYRYPGGHMSWRGMEAADAALAARGVSWIDWNCMTGDAEKRPTTSGDQGVDMVVGTLANSGNPRAAVMLSHDSSGGYVSLQSLPRLVAWFRASGYGFGVIG